MDFGRVRGLLRLLSSFCRLDGSSLKRRTLSFYIFRFTRTRTEKTILQVIRVVLDVLELEREHLARVGDFEEELLAQRGGKL